METTATTLRSNSAAFTVRQLSPALGAEIVGVDLRDPIDETLKQKFLDTWHQHLVILVRNQTLDEEDQVRFAENFGPPAKTSSGRTFRGVKNPSVMLVSNIREDGKPIGALPDGEMHFHTDQCHQEIPAKGSAPVSTALSIATSDVVRVAPHLAAGARDYRLSARLSFATSLGNITVDVVHEGTL